MKMYDIIRKKRDNEKLSYSELKFFIEGICSGEIPDYQTSAFLMAAFIKGMDIDETSWLCRLMTESGDVVDLDDSLPTVDKHSTGGVGDKTTLIVSPIASACGLYVAKMSGKGLGHTGGTIDKLESIPGFRTSFSLEEFTSLYKKNRICIAGQSGNLVPADKILYGLRDVTATVDSIPLIATSIMSKKLAGGSKNIVLDVKTGDGSFMKDIKTAAELARQMVSIGEKNNRNVSVLITSMDYPLGNCIGNSIEVMESIDILKNRVKGDLYDVSVSLAAEMIHLAKDIPLDKAKDEAEDAILSGKALLKFKEMVSAQGGNDKVIEDYSIFGKAKNEYRITSLKDGYISNVKAKKIGQSSMSLGAGREKKESSIDYNAGIRLYKKYGDRVEKGECIASLYTSKDDYKDVIGEVNDAFEYSQVPPVKQKLIYGRVSSAGTEYFI